MSCVRAYLSLFMFTGFRLHTTETIKSGQDELKKFDESVLLNNTILVTFSLLTDQNIQKFKKKSTFEAEKNWDIPKMHLHGHVIKDTLEKGVTCNYNTKINENLHGSIKDIYEQIGNGKNVDDKSIYFDYPSYSSFLLDHDYLSVVTGLPAYLVYD